MRVGKFIAAAALVWAGSLGLIVHADEDAGGGLNVRLAGVLAQQGFTGRIESTLERRLGRPINKDLAHIGRLVFFDNVQGLHEDNSCAGCHSPTNGFGDTQSIAIGVDNNGLVGPNRTGPRNQRRSPIVINNAFYPKLMWNGRFSANPVPGETLGDPFDNAQGFKFPLPEGDAVMFFPPNNHPGIKHLLQAQAFLPSTELVEMAGFTGTAGTFGKAGKAGKAFDQFDNHVGQDVPPPDGSNSRNEPIRTRVLEIINSKPGYKLAFAKVFPQVGPSINEPITFEMMGQAMAEFEFTLTFANAPVDKFARGNHEAMTAAEKRGALVFFGEGKCVTCHAVKGKANEMFSDFENYVLGIPQIVPFFGVGRSNIIYDGPRANEDFGAEQISKDPDDRYKFRASPLRNIAVQAAFFHNGSFTTIEGAIRHHLDAVRSARNYDPKKAGIDTDLTRRKMGPIGPVLDNLSQLLVGGIDLRESEVEDLVEFVTTGLLDKRALKENLCKLVPKVVPSRMPVATFEGCPNNP